jgi:4-hydroxythreonine-4-phosphate dehydrogenase
MEKDTRVRVGITHGDINGIGYEVIIKSLMDPRICELFTPILYGSSKIASYHRKILNIQDFSFNLIKRADQASPKRPNIINCFDYDVKIEIGKSTEQAGELAILALNRALEDLKNKHIDVLVTAPLNKSNVRIKLPDFTGHTDYIAQKFNTTTTLMLMICEKIRIAVLTGHLPISGVAPGINAELVSSRLSVLHNSLVRDFGVPKPRIAVLGLNPHASDQGIFGQEEQQVIYPAIRKSFEAGILAFGPFPADGFFGSFDFTKYDAVLAMYHDQGLIPFKTLCFENGVNYTAGLPVIRTSPAHGTAYDIAGKGVASEESMKEAIFQGITIFKNRSEQSRLTRGQLRVTGEEVTDSLPDEGIKDIPEEDVPLA